MSQPQEIWFRESVRTARTLPLREAVLFIQGLLMSCHDSEAKDEMRKIYTSLANTDKQLQLIEDGQLRLKFEVLALGEVEASVFPTDH